MKAYSFFIIPFLFMTQGIFAQTVTNQRTADLQDGIYTISGQALLEELDNGKVQLRLSDDFTTPEGPDVRIYLSTGDRVNDASIEIADIGSGSGGVNHFSGAITFDVPAGITIDQYNYIVFYCYDFQQHWAHGQFGAAQGTGNSKVSIQGQVTLADGTPVAGFDVFLNDQSSSITNASGQYTFEDLDGSENYTIAPKANENVEFGISTRDLVLIRKHLLDIEPFTSDFQNIAADISNNGSVSTKDLVELQKIILAIDTTFENNQSYRFVQEATLADLDPSDFTESATFDNLTEDQNDVDFIAIKIGDVSNSAISGLLGDDTQPQSALELSIDELHVTSGESISVPISSNNFRDITAFQFTIHLDGFSFEGIQSDILKDDELQFAQIDDETVTVLWSSAESIDIDDNVFSIQLIATDDMPLSQGISFSSRLTRSVAYASSGDGKDIQFNFVDAATADKNLLLQNIPNPFSHQTIIPFHLSEGSNVSLRIYNVTGSLVQSIDQYFDKGQHQLTIKGLDQLAEGVLIYQLTAGDFQETRKMIKR